MKCAFSTFPEHEKVIEFIPMTIFKEKDKGMKTGKTKEDRKKKWDNFWYYYKYHVLIGAFALFCIITFAKDMLEKVSYDYEIGFLGNYSMVEEDKRKIEEWFTENAKDLNKDGEVHVQINDYFIPSEGDKGYDPQMVMAGQTKFTVDVQSATSMVYFVSEKSYEKFKEMEVFPEDESQLIEVKNCKAFKELGSPASLQDMYITMRILPEVADNEKGEEAQKYYEESEQLVKKFIGE